MYSRIPASSLEPPTCDDRPVWDLMLAWNPLPTLMAADELGLFPLLDGAPGSREAIRDELSIGDRACEAMLGVPVSLDFLAMRLGKQCTIDELDELLRGAGLTDVELMPTYGHYSLVSARKP